MDIYSLVCLYCIQPVSRFLHLVYFWCICILCGNALRVDRLEIKSCLVWFMSRFWISFCIFHVLHSFYHQLIIVFATLLAYIANVSFSWTDSPLLSVHIWGKYLYKRVISENIENITNTHISLFCVSLKMKKKMILFCDTS